MERWLPSCRVTQPKSMANRFLQLLLTRSVRAAQMRYYGRSPFPRENSEEDLLTQDEIEFIGARDSFYMATISESGWPYIQHRGGKPGFLRVVSPKQLA